MVLDKDLVLCLPFSEGGGSKAYDRSKHQNHGTISGALAVGALEDGSGWLLDWDKRIKITIDHNDIDTDLTDFPIFIPLGTSVGIDSDDVSCVFDEVGANSLKIAVTDASGVTQCYVEVERWDNGNELAWLWVKVPSVSSSADTILYLYYDNDHADNSTYVGVPNSVPAENVWNTDFKLTTHMQDDPDNANIRDSTENDNDGAKIGANEPIEATEIIGKCQNFDGVNDCISIPNSAELNFGTGDFSVIIWMKTTEATAGEHIIIRKDDEAGAPRRFWSIIANNYAVPIFELFDSNEGVPLKQVAGGTTINDGGIHCIVGVRDGDNIYIYVDGQLDGGPTTGCASHNIDSADVIMLGRYTTTLGGYFKQYLDELEIINKALSLDEIKAIYESGRDHLATFGSERNRVIAVNWRFGKALYFDGVNDYVQIADNPSISLGTSDFTIAFWVKLNELGVDHPLINKYGAVAYQGWRVEMTTSNYVQVYAGDGIGATFDISLSSSPIALDTEWHHIAVVGDRDSNVQIYIDGIAVGTPDTTDITVDISTAMPLQIGRWAWAGIYANVILDEVHVYSRALTPEEIRTLYEKTTH